MFLNQLHWVVFLCVFIFSLSLFPSSPYFRPFLSVFIKLFFLVKFVKWILCNVAYAQFRFGWKIMAIGEDNNNHCDRRQLRPRCRYRHYKENPRELYFCHCVHAAGPKLCRFKSDEEIWCNRKVLALSREHEIIFPILISFLSLYVSVILLISF